VLIVTCIPCHVGAHEEHYEVVQPVSEGVLGGAKCLCKGECRDRPPQMTVVQGIIEALNADGHDHGS
jgi:hypothetical protein